MTESITLSRLDIAVVVLYMLVVLGIGLYFRKFSSTDIEHFFLAGRKLPGWMNGISYAVTCMNAEVAPAYCGMTVISGIFVCWWYFSRFGLALMIGAVLFAVFWRRLELFTAPEFYEVRYSGKVGTIMRSWVTIRSAFIAVVAWTGAGLLGMHKIVGTVFGWSRALTFSVVIPAILFYVLLSGYMGVVFTDVLQTVVLIIAGLVLCGAVLVDFGGPAGLYEALVSTHGSSVVSWHPPADHEMLGLLGILAWIIGTAIGYGGDVSPMAGAMEGQRILSCKNSREASRMYIWTEVMLFIMLLVVTLPALGAMVRWPGLYTGEINKETAYGLLIAHYLPHGLLGLAIVSMAASIMSTVDSNLNFGSQVFLSDIYRRFIRPGMSQAHYMNVGRAVMFVIMGLALIVASNAVNLIDIAVFMLGLSSAEISANWGQWWWWRFNGKARLAASLGGPVIFIVVKYLLFRSMGAYVHILISITVTTILWISIALLTKPDDEERLISFYRKASPLGFWGPIARKAGRTPEDRISIAKGLVLACIGTVAVATGILAASELFVGKWGIAGLFALVCVVAAGLFIPRFRRLLTSFEKRGAD